MKRMLIIMFTFVFLLGMMGTAAAAATKFVDVPAKHWAYEAVAELGKAGIIEGYGDETFRGDRCASRYEMAMMVSRSLEHYGAADKEKKALIEKLVGEFRDELKDLGVRVANLEKKSSSIKFSGDARIRYQNNWDLRDFNGRSDCFKHERFQERIRIYTQADLSKRTEFQGRISGQNTSNESKCPIRDNGSTTGNMTWEIAKFVHKDVVPGVNIELGRSDLLLGQGLLADTDGGYDSIRFTFGSKQLKGFYAYGDIAATTGIPFIRDPISYIRNIPMGDYNAYIDGVTSAVNISTLNLSWQANENWNVTAANLRSHSYWYPYNIFALGFKGHIHPFTLTSEYAKNNHKEIDGSPEGDTGWMTSLWYKGADKKVVGSWGVYMDYRDVGRRAIDGRLTTLNGLAEPYYPEFTNGGNGYGYWSCGAKGFGYGFNYTFTENAVFTATVEKLQMVNAPGKQYSPLVYLRVEYTF